MRVDSRVVLAAGAIVVLAGCDDTTFTAASARIEAAPSRIDFGTVDVNQDAFEALTLRNVGDILANVTSLEVNDDCGGCFSVVSGFRRTVQAFDETELQLRFRPTREAIATATVTISIDDRTAPPVDVFLKGRGRQGCVPDVAVAPEQLDFGFVPAGGIGLSSFVVRSTGNCDLRIDRIGVEPDGAPFRVTTSTPAPGQPGVLVAGGQTSVSLRAELDETATGTTTAAVRIVTNVPVDKNVPGAPGVVLVPMTASANRAPVADAGKDLTVEPWSRATLDGGASFDPDGPDENLRYEWRLVNRPGGSTTRLERSSTAQPSFWADLTGLYELELVVIDELGLQSDPARVVVEALPTNAIRIELTWDHPDSDLDLHLIREGGLFCQCANDVHYRDCARAPQWFEAAPGANPRLDVDDRTGFGPENINLDGDGPDRFIPDGVYTIAVHYFSANAEVSQWPTSVSNATIRVFVFGLLAAEFTRALENDGDLWTVAEIRWPDRTPVEVDRLVIDQTCGIF